MNRGKGVENLAKTCNVSGGLFSKRHISIVNYYDLLNRANFPNVPEMAPANLSDPTNRVQTRKTAHGSIKARNVASLPYC
jgi:hypothetical protein